MLQPINVPNQLLTKMGFIEEDIKALSELTRWVEACENIGMGTSFSSLMGTLGRSREMRSLIEGVFRRVQERAIPNDKTP